MSSETRKPNLVHEARVALEARIAKYNDPKNLEWEWGDAQKWERHALNAILDLQVAESELSRLQQERDELESMMRKADKDAQEWRARFHELRDGIKQEMLNSPGMKALEEHMRVCPGLPMLINADVPELRKRAESAERELKALRVENAQAWGEAADVGGELDELRGELKALREQMRWIPVKEKLPTLEHGGVGLVPCDFYVTLDDEQFRGFYDPLTRQWTVALPNDDWTAEVYDVTHWRALGPGPEGGK